MQSFHQAWPYVVGLTVWGTSIALLLQGLWVGAWYGYTLLAIFVVFGLMVNWLCRRIQRRVKAEFWREFWERQ